jgi:hypothetical protein
VSAFVKGLRVLAHGKEELCEEHDEQNGSNDREPTWPNTAGEHGDTPTE